MKYLFEEYEKEQHEESKLLSIIEEETDEIENISALIGQYAVNYLCKKPCRTSEQTGYLWVQEILCGHDIRCYEMFRMEKHVFFKFCDELVEQGLKSTRQMGVQEMVAMFLNTVGHGVGNRMIQERFQHSGETVSRHFHEVLVACLRLSIKYIKPSDPKFQNVHSKIKNDQRYWPFFKNAIGAIDGTHIPCVVSPSDQPKFIGRKGYPTQNIMAVCDWDMCFIFALPGWEGTAHDARVFDNAITTPTMNFPHPPPGKYYLVDAGYPTPKGYIGPYKCERYHLADFRRSSGFTNHNEIVCATMAIHNFIRRHSETDTEFNQYEHANILDGEDNSYVGENSDQTLTISSSAEMDRVRDSIRDQIVNHMQ
ncbi:uncharacterized protein LOC130980551 [Arachis stenosperma]|uniref:uncharacterized protein LOC130933543 n=1 Tax=Arachis stenosperma TaxID=217475 RepID=UPI0025AD8251|nr:uncharacterized protein LOC130933543 [Arachis stenosperma]XP_057760200.1 uncharacterized protein LOC130980551 [Arachis stenosperma]